MSLAAGLLQHAALAVTFRHDGRGLPTRFTQAFWALLTLAVLASSIRHGTIAAGGVFFVQVLLVAYLLGSRRFVLASLFCLISLSIDMVATPVRLMDLLPDRTHGLIFDSWEFAATIACAYQAIVRLRTERQ